MSEPIDPPTVVVIKDYELAKKIVLKAIEGDLYIGGITTEERQMFKTAESIVYSAIEARKNGTENRYVDAIFELWSGESPELAAKEPGKVSVQSVATTTNHIKISVANGKIRIAKGDGVRHEAVKIEIATDEWDSVNRFVCGEANIGDAGIIDAIKTVIYRRHDVPGGDPEKVIELISELIMRNKP